MDKKQITDESKLRNKFEIIINELYEEFNPEELFDGRPLEEFLIAYCVFDLFNHGMKYSYVKEYIDYLIAVREEALDEKRNENMH